MDNQTRCIFVLQSGMMPKPSETVAGCTTKAKSFLTYRNYFLTIKTSTMFNTKKMFAPDANETAGGTTAAPVVKMKTDDEYKSEKRTELEAQKKAEFEKFKTLEFDTPDWVASQMELYKIGVAIKGEIANLKNIEAEQLLQEKRNERIALVDKLLEAHDANMAAQADRKATIEAKNAAYDVFKNAKEVVTNELLGRYATAKPKVTTDGTATTAPAGERGATSAAIKASLLKHLAVPGTTIAAAKKAVEAEGFSRGTVGSVATQMIKDREITA